MKNQVDSAERARIIEATGHPSRLTMPHALADGEKCVCDLRDLVAADRRIKQACGAPS